MENKTLTSNVPKVGTKLTGIVTHLRDGDTVEEMEFQSDWQGWIVQKKVLKKDYATKIAKQFKGLKMTCELIGAKLMTA